MILTNISEQDKSIAIFPELRAFDDEGNQYNEGYYVRPDGKKTTNWSDVIFPAGLPVKMKVAILGSGNGALAMAFEWARAGHDIYMYDFL